MDSNLTHIAVFAVIFHTCMLPQHQSRLASIIVPMWMKKQPYNCAHFTTFSRAVLCADSERSRRCRGPRGLSQVLAARVVGLLQGVAARFDAEA